MKPKELTLRGLILGALITTVTIPLRRALMTNSDLPYPEGVAAAEVLKVGSGTRGETKDEMGEAKEGLVAVVLGFLAGLGDFGRSLSGFSQVPSACSLWAI